MPYSIAWDSTLPLGSTDSDNIDEQFRMLKVQIEERMNTILSPSGQWDDDPIVLELPTGGVALPAVGDIIYPPHLIFTGGGLGTITGVTPSFVAISGNAIFPLTVGEVFAAGRLLNVNLAINPAGTLVNWELFRTDFPGSSSVSVKAGSTTSPTPEVIQIYSSATDGEQLFNAVARYTISFTSAGPWNLFGVKLLYQLGV